MQQKFGRVDACLMSDRFTAKGKEEYSEAIHKVRCRGHYFAIDYFAGTIELRC